MLISVSGQERPTYELHVALGKKGSCINFKVVEGKLKFELNQATFNASNLKVSGTVNKYGYCDIAIIVDRSSKYFTKIKSFPHLDC